MAWGISRCRRPARWCSGRNRRSPRRTLVWADRSGVTTPIPIEPRAFWTPRLSPDGRQFAVVVDDSGRRNIWIYRFDNATFLPIASEGLNRTPVWTRDGLRLAYLSERDGVRHLMSQPSDSSAPAESLLTSQSDDLFPGSWSADGRSLVFVDGPPTDNSEVRVLQIEGRQVTAVPGIPVRSNRPAISPDGRWLAYGVRAVQGIRAASDLRPAVSRPRAVTSIRRCRRPASVEQGRREDLFPQQTRRAVGVFRRRHLRNAFRSFAWHRGRPGTAIVPESLCRRRE